MVTDHKCAMIVAINPAANKIYDILCFILLVGLVAMISKNKNPEVKKDANRIAKKALDGPKELTSFIQYTQSALTTTIFLQADTIRWQRRFNLGLILVLVSSFVVIAILATNPDPIPQSFAKDTKGRTIEIVATNELAISTTDLRLWTESCITNGLELSFVNPIKRINTILNTCFSQKGKNSYQDWLLKGTSNQKIHLGKAGSVYADSELGLIISKKITLSASPKAPGRIIEMKPIIDPNTNEMIERWQVSLPLLLRKEEGIKGAGTGSVVAVVTLTKNNSDDFPYGAAIDSFVISKER